ncbi:MAG: hypothetical protein ACYTGW_02115 [Planctomycetota bacterium]|jgi:hypothetical protein
MNSHRLTTLTALAPALAATVATLALSAAATSQANTKVIPLSRTNTEGSSGSAFPFAYTVGRTQQIWRGSALTQAVAILNGISYRRDGGGGAYAKVDYPSLTVSIGLTTVTPKSMSTTFSSNITAPLTAVINKAKYSLPASAAPTTPPAPFGIHVNWTSGFVFDSRKGNLIVEWNIPGTAAKNSYFLDAERFSGTSGGGSAVPFGTFGKFSSPEQVTFSAVPGTLKLGGTLDVNATSFSKPYTAKLIFGVSKTIYNSTNLPYDLGAIGAPGNNLYTSMDILLPFPLNPFRPVWQGRFTAPIPNSPPLAGLTFYTQSYYADAGANPAGLVASNGVELKVAAASNQPETNLVGFHDATQATGWLSFGANVQGGPVVRFKGVLP